MPVYPGSPEVLYEDFCTHEKDGFAESAIHFTSHVGTHIDFPYHILQGGKSSADFELETFMGKGLRVTYSLNDKNIIDEIDSKISMWGIPGFILICTHWDRYWGKPEYFVDFPLPGKEVFKYLASLKLKGIGIDTASVDEIYSETLENHKILMENELVIIENMTNLNKLPDSIFNFFCFPLKLQKGNGSPVRAVAQLIE